MAKDNKKSDGETRKRGQIADKGKGDGKGPAVGKLPKRGINKIPGYLRHEVGLHDWIASSVVIVGGGLTMTALVWFLSAVWPG